MMKRIGLIGLFCVLAWSIAASPKHEIRAAWLTTNWGLDWPSAPVRTPREIAGQQRELCDRLDRLRALNLNVVFFQVRLRGDVLYPSAIEPWSPVLTGKAGKSPGYDPLAFAIQACHERGLECHAWMVVFPVGSEKQVRAHAKASVVRRHPDWCKRWKGEWYLDPGVPAVADYLAGLAREVVSKYDLDGIHLDYIRYPDDPSGFPDGATYRRYAPSAMPLAAWREANITRVVTRLYDAVKAVKPGVAVSCASLGKYESLPSYPSGGWSCRERVFQDVRQWLRSGKLDFVVPMLYYDREGFYPFLYDWIRESGGRPVVAGLGAYRLEERSGWGCPDLLRQVGLSRVLRVSGHAFYRARNLETKSLSQALQCDYYAQPALLPPFAFLDSIPPAPVTELSVETGDAGVLLRWEGAADTRYYTLYGSRTGTIDYADPAYLLERAIYRNDFRIAPERCREFRTFALTASDPFHNEGAPVEFRLEAPDTSVFRVTAGERILRLDRVYREVLLFSEYDRLLFQARDLRDVTLPELEAGVYRLTLRSDENVRQCMLIVQP